MIAKDVIIYVVIVGQSLFTEERTVTKSRLLEEVKFDVFISFVQYP